MAGELITSAAQVEWDGQLWGDNTLYRVTSMVGWAGRPGVDSGSVPRAQQPGAYLGRLLVQARSIGLDMELIGGPEDNWALLAALEDATALRQDEEALVVSAGGRTLLAWARITDVAMPIDTPFHEGFPRVSVLWEATDPRRYSVAESSTSAVLPTAETGLSFGSPTETGLSFGSPVETGLSFGTAGASGDLLVTNDGNADSNPVIEIRGPVTTPTVTLGALRLEYALTLAATDTLIVDTRAGTVTLGGQSRIGAVTSRSVPEESFVLPPGQSVLSFRADPGSTDPAAQATVRWRSAYM